MSLLAAWVVFPILLALLCAGLGLLVDRLSGRQLRGALLVPAGFAAMVVVGTFTTATEATAPLTVPAVVFLAILGAGLSLPWRFGRPDPLVALVALAVFAVFAAPVLLSGSPTFAGYIKLDDTATWLALTDRVMEHGRSLSGLDISSYRATLAFNLADGYPIGVFVPFGTAQKLGGGDLAWVFQPYVSFLASLLSLSLWKLFGGVLRDRRQRAVAAFIAAQPALLYGYAMWGGVKEVAAAALLALACALAPLAVREGSRLRDVALPALATAALLGVLSPAGGLWVAPPLLIVAALAQHRYGLRTAAIRAGAFLIALAALAAPVLASGIVPPTSKPLVGSNGEGNLLGPLDPLQVMGVWPAGDFRVDPAGTVATAVLLVLGIVAALAGLYVLWRRHAIAPLLFASVLLACAAIVFFGSPWAGGKALATASPVALSLAMLGGWAAFRFDRLTGTILLVCVAGGVLWSNVLAYGGADLAPYGQLRELERIGSEFAGEGPALMTEYNPYGARHFLRGVDVEGVSELRYRRVPLLDGDEVQKGYAADTDELDPAGLFEFRTLVLRRSPVRSRPPFPYRRVWTGKYYEVWQRPEGERRPPGGFIGLGSDLSPSAVPSCQKVVALSLQAQAENADLLASRHAPVIDATEGPFEVPRPGRYGAWLLGSVRGEVELLVDGRPVGTVRHELENEGSFVELGQVDLGAGRHQAELRFGGPDLHPGSGGFPRPRTGPLLLAPAGDELGRLVRVPPSRARTLCGQPWDWITLVPQE